MNCYKCATPLPDNSKFCMACGADVSGDHTHVTGTMQPDPELLNMLQAELGNEYKIEKELGRGGMAIVFLGQDKQLGRKVAIKLLPPMLTFGAGSNFIDRFKREARTAATLDHPHIIPVYRVSSGGKLFWYVMKFLTGESLDVTLKRDGQFDVDRVVQIVTQTADALDYAHSNKVVHRDIKPANIMLDNRGRVTVTDFGIAKALEATAYTNSGATIGTPHYMAPEQCAGLPLTGAADQYALAISAYQMLSGHLPFAADSVLELMRMHAQDPPPPLETLRPSLHPELVNAVERGLAKDADDRFPTCMDLARALADAAGKMDPAARKPSPTVGQETAASIRLNTPRGQTPPGKRTPAPSRTTIAKGKSPVAPRPLTRTQIETPRATKRLYWSIGGGVALIAVFAALYPFLNKPDAPANVQTSQPRQAPPSTPNDTSKSPAVSASNTDTQRTADSVAPETKSAAAPVDTNRAPESAPTRTKQPPPRSGKQNTVRQETKQPVVAKVDTAFLTVGVNSAAPASILINGKPAEGNPVRDYPVVPGKVTITIQVTDSTVWTMDTVVTILPGQRLRVPRITPHRK